MQLITLSLLVILLRSDKSAVHDIAILLQADLESIRSNLLQRHGAYVNLTGDERLLQAAQPLVNDFLQAMPVRAGEDSDWTTTLPRLNEAITVPTQVCFLLCMQPCRVALHACQQNCLHLQFPKSPLSAYRNILPREFHSVLLPISAH